MSETDGRQSKLHILLVEDEPGLQEALALILELEDYDVGRANDGLEALAQLAQRRPDLIISDYMMPHMNGLELIRRVRADDTLADLPILLMSAALPHTADKTLADAFLEKPAPMARFLEVINQLLKKA